MDAMPRAMMSGVPLIEIPGLTEGFVLSLDWRVSREAYPESKGRPPVIVIAVPALLHTWNGELGMLTQFGVPVITGLNRTTQR